MNPIERLRQEHQLELMVMQAAQREIGFIVSQGAPRPDRVEKLVLFFKRFVAGFHRVKEEKHLFPTLERRGLSGGTGPLAWVLEEHRETERLLKRIEKALPPSQRGNSSATNIVRCCLSEYIYMLRHHVKREEEFLYPASAVLLQPDDLSRLTEAFDAVEAREIDCGSFESNHTLISELVLSVA